MNNVNELPIVHQHPKGEPYVPAGATPEEIARDERILNLVYKPFMRPDYYDAFVRYYKETRDNPELSKKQKSERCVMRAKTILSFSDNKTWLRRGGNFRKYGGLTGIMNNIAKKLRELQKEEKQQGR
jgi:hypothetical protein